MKVKQKLARGGEKTAAQETLKKPVEMTQQGGHPPQFFTGGGIDGDDLCQRLQGGADTVSGTLTVSSFFSPGCGSWPRLHHSIKMVWLRFEPTEIREMGVAVSSLMRRR